MENILQKVDYTRKYLAQKFKQMFLLEKICESIYSRKYFTSKQRLYSKYEGISKIVDSF